MKPVWTILGAGAMGCLSAFELHSTGYPVQLSVRPERLPDWPGALQLTTPEGDRHSISVQCLSAADTSPVQALLITTKAADTLTALQALKDRLLPGASVVVLQNGMGSQQAVAEELPEHPVYAASTTNGAFCDAPFQVNWAGRGETLIGPLNPAATEQPVPLADLSGWQACEDIEAVLWRKLAINCVINPLTAVNQCRNGQLLEDISLKAQLQQLCSEVETLAQACDIQLFDVPLFVQACHVARQTAQNYSSMCQDMRLGRTTEIDFINGYLLKQAERKGLTLALNSQLFRRIKALTPTPA